VQNVLVFVGFKQTEQSLRDIGDFFFLTRRTGFFLEDLTDFFRFLIEVGFLHLSVDGFLICGGTQDFLHFLKFAGCLSEPCLHFKIQRFVLGFNS